MNTVIYGLDAENRFVSNINITSMVIKRKDGSIYKLRGPNPIMINQVLWENDKTIVHNINPQEIVTKEGYATTEEEEPVESLDDIQPEEIEVPAIEIDPSKLPPQTKKKRIVPKDKPKDMVYVLPAQMQETYDALYGETRSQLTFGGKFTMEVIIVDRSDLQVALWTNSTTVDIGSIIYVPKDKRWWKVQESYDKGEGHVMICVPSSLQPSFE